MSQQNQHDNKICCHNRWLLWQQSILFILLCVFMVFVGVRIDLFSRHIDSTRTSTLSRAAEFQQLTQMNAIINQQLNLIVEQHAENKALRERLRQNVASTNENVNRPVQPAR